MNNQIKVELLDLYGSDQVVMDSARVSSGKQPKDLEKFIERLAKEGHDSCFEHLVSRWKLRVPQKIGVQIVRHRIASHNCASARYNHKFDELYKVADGDIHEVIFGEIEHHAGECLRLYNKIIEEYPTNKRIRELAAMCIPQGVLTEQILTINFRSLQNFLQLRDSPYAQLEIQFVAQEMKRILTEQKQIKFTNKYLLNIE